MHSTPTTSISKWRKIGSRLARTRDWMCEMARVSWRHYSGLKCVLFGWPKQCVTRAASSSLRVSARVSTTYERRAFHRLARHISAIGEKVAFTNDGNALTARERFSELANQPQTTTTTEIVYTCACVRSGCIFIR